MSKAYLSVFFVLATSISQAQSNNKYLYSDNYYKIAKVEITELNEEEFEIYAKEESSPLIEIPINILPGVGTGTPPVKTPTPAPKDELSKVTEIIKIGKEIWTIISNNKPKVNLQTDRISIVPLGLKDVGALSGWQKPKVTNYKVSFKNFYGMEVVNLQFKNIFSYGGSLNGVGAYIANASILPSKIRVAWGYEVNAQAYTGMALNYGSEKSPVAALEMSMNYKISTDVSYHEASLNYIIDGKGNIDMLD